MIVKILGVIDLLISLAIFSTVLGLSIPRSILIIAIIILAAKGLFIITGSIASGIDLLVGIVLVLSLFLTVPKAILLVCTFLLLQKGFISLL